MTGHALTGPTRDGDIVIVSCTCGVWTRRWASRHAPDLSEAESDHEAHRRHAGARELQTGDRPLAPAPAPRVPSTGIAGLGALVGITTALADLAKQSGAAIAAMEALQEFAAAHAHAKQDGVGVVVVRHPDGTITTTPNVFIQAGTAAFIDQPGTTPAFTPHPDPVGHHLRHGEWPRPDTRTTPAADVA